MKIVLGPYHPQLEDALAQEIRARREQDPLAPLLLVVPSETLRQRIKLFLAHERGLLLLNVHVRTFFQLSLSLFHEVHGPAEPTLRNDTFMEEALKRVVSLRGRFAPIAENNGARSALWQSLRDLKDGMVDPESALEALSEGLFGQLDQDLMTDLFSLYQEMKLRFPEWRAQDHQDLDATVARYAPVSAYLGQFERIYYYGFYDLTQSQLELFRSVAANYSVTLLYPLAHGHPDWSFAQDFYDRYLRGLAGADEVVDLLHDNTDSIIAQNNLPPSPATSREPRREIVSCAGPRDEILTVAKSILRLVEEEGFDLQRVGVVARSLDAYLPWIQEIFPDHGIPFHTPTGEPLWRFSRVRAMVTLLDLPVHDYMRMSVIDLLTSHDFNFESVLSPSDEPRPELWDIATRRLRITRGIAEWRRLEGYLDRGLDLNLMDEEEGRPLHIEGQQLSALLKVVNGLHQKLGTLPKEGAWSDLSARWRAVIDEFLYPGSGEVADRVTEVIDHTFDELSTLETITPRVSFQGFVEILHKSLDRATVPLDLEVMQGVQVMDAGSARGIPLQALFLIGMNEGVFPRTIREDPFLRDRARRVLETDLGYKISSKLGGYDEEKLLFALLSGSATDCLYYSYQRSDVAGRSLTPSWYLREIDTYSNQETRAITTCRIPKSVLDKQHVSPFDDPRWLLPEELAVRRALGGEDPTQLVRISGASLEGFAKSTAVVRTLENSAGAPGKFDGVTGPLEDIWREILEHGISPTTLESYGRCPFQYFARRALQLEQLGRPEEATPVQALERGQICHDILQRFYQEPDRVWANNRNTWLDHVAAEVLSTFAERSPTGYPVAWEAVKEELVAMLQEVIEVDLEEMAQSGFRPVELEKDLTARLGVDWPEDLQGLPVHGRLDRIDQNDQEGCVRVVDYKYKTGRSPQAEDNNPLLAAVRGRKLQLPLYVLLASAHAVDMATTPSFEAAWYFLAHRWEEGPLAPRSFSGQSMQESAGQQIRDTVARFLRGIRSGEFFIMPGDYCRYCEVSEICRKDHFSSSIRAARHPGAKALSRMRKVKEPKT